MKDEGSGWRKDVVNQCLEFAFVHLLQQKGSLSDSTRLHCMGHKLKQKQASEELVVSAERIFQITFEAESGVGSVVDRRTIDRKVKVRVPAGAAGELRRIWDRACVCVPARARARVCSGVCACACACVCVCVCVCVCAFACLLACLLVQNRPAGQKKFTFNLTL